MGLMERLERAKMAKVASEKDVSLEELEYYDEYESFKESIHAELVKTAASEEGLGLQEVISRLVEEKGEEIPKPTQKRLIQQIVDEAAGLGPLERLLKDDTISEVMVNGPYSIYVERSGKLDLTEIKLRDDKHVLDLINLIVTPIGRRCDEASPMVDARLKDGSRVNAIIPPLALSGPTITIRKFSKVPLRAENLIDFGSASFGMLGFLDACVKARANVVVCGGTGSGKTTLLKLITGELTPTGGTIERADFTYIYLDQEYSLIQNEYTVSEQAEAFNLRHLPEHETKTILNRYLFPQDVWNKPCSKLSGGEKMRLAFCCLMIADNTPDLFILDEPTNNLDIESIEIITATIRNYQGTVLAVSHDRDFLKETGIEQEISFFL